MNQITITLPDGSQKHYDKGTTPLEVASDIGKRLARDAMAAKINGTLYDLTRPIETDAEITILTFDDPIGEDVYRHTSAHVMAQAVKRLFPEAKLAIGPPIENGFYYDFDLSHNFTPEDLERIEEEAKKIIKEDIGTERREMSKEEAIEFFREKDEEYKIELIKALENGEITVYEQGDFVDLCRGPHLPSTGRVSAKGFKILNAAGAYWHGDENQPMLQRIYATSFPNPKDLRKYLKQLEEAKKRDHRKLGKELGLFTIEEDAGAGLILWHPKGAMLREIMERFWKEEHRKRGYELVSTPHIARSHLWETSGHYDFYRENMYTLDIDEQEYVLKPMNCPYHILIYKSDIRSYRDLPIRYAELGTVYRYERSGVLHGMLRVRGFTQDDAHIFCTPDQLEDEIYDVIQLADFMLTKYGFEKYKIDLSVRDPEDKGKYAGDDESWEKAEASLINALKRKGWDYHRAEGEAVFYGPKIDIKLVDALGREWQATTIQFDFNLPARFGIYYIGEDNQHHTPFVVHRAIMGSLERFVGTLIEHHAGAFPLWLAPEQIRILTITDDQEDYARELHEKLISQGFRAELDLRNEKLGYKIREGTIQKVPYLLIIGDREVEQGKVSVRKYGEGDVGAIKTEEFIQNIKKELD